MIAVVCCAIILNLGLDVELVVVAEEHTVALLSAVNSIFNPAATAEDCTEIELDDDPPPLLLLKQVSSNKLETPSHTSGIDKGKSRFPIPVVGVYAVEAKTTVVAPALKVVPSVDADTKPALIEKLFNTRGVPAIATYPIVLID